MRILALAHNFPYPIPGGETLRIHHLFKRLARRHEVSLLTLGPVPEDRGPLGGGLFRTARQIDRRIPPPALAAGLLSELKPDAVCIGATSLFFLAGFFSPIPVILDVMDDLYAALERDLAAEPEANLKGRIQKQLEQMRQFEVRVLPKAAACLLVSELDARSLEDRLQAAGARVRVVVNSNGVDTDYFRPQGLAEEFPTIAFSGVMSWPPNIDGALNLCQEILPRVRRRVAGARALLIGRNVPEVVLSLASSHVTVTGTVDDIRPYLERASVVVCPLRKTSGIKNKILEAWAMAKPVVATGRCVGGLHVREGENLLIADDPETFADHVCSLLQEPALRTRLGAMARQTAERHHSWDDRAAELETLLSNFRRSGS